MHARGLHQDKNAPLRKCHRIFTSVTKRLAVRCSSSISSFDISSLQPKQTTRVHYCCQFPKRGRHGLMFQPSSLSDYVFGRCEMQDRQCLTYYTPSRVECRSPEKGQISLTSSGALHQSFRLLIELNTLYLLNTK